MKKMTLKNLWEETRGYLLVMAAAVVLAVLVLGSICIWPPQDTPAEIERQEKFDAEWKNETYTSQDQR